MNHIVDDCISSGNNTSILNGTVRVFSGDDEHSKNVLKFSWM